MDGPRDAGEEAFTCTLCASQRACLPTLEGSEVLSSRVSFLLSPDFPPSILDHKDTQNAYAVLTSI